MILWLDLQNDAILVELGKDGGDLALAERVVECVIDGLGEYIEPRCFFPVHRHLHLQATALLVGGDVCQFRLVAESGEEFG